MNEEFAITPDPDGEQLHVHLLVGSLWWDVCRITDIDTSTARLAFHCEFDPDRQRVRVRRINGRWTRWKQAPYAFSWKSLKPSILVSSCFWFSFFAAVYYGVLITATQVLGWRLALYVVFLCLNIRLSMFWYPRMRGQEE